MATDPNDIQLSKVQRRLLAELADHFGLNWSRLVDQFLELANQQSEIERQSWIRLQQDSLNRVWDNGQDSVFDDR